MIVRTCATAAATPEARAPSMWTMTGSDVESMMIFTRCFDSRPRSVAPFSPTICDAYCFGHSIFSAAAGLITPLMRATAVPRDSWFGASILIFTGSFSVSTDIRAPDSSRIRLILAPPFPMMSFTYSLSQVSVFDGGFTIAVTSSTAFATEASEGPEITTASVLRSTVTFAPDSCCIVWMVAPFGPITRPTRCFGHAIRFSAMFEREKGRISFERCS
mmetsp:Transcript_9833/g.24719  ORF Transcript_9833/g.24719 Transcript_9833/m.24719 type:complete len:217 (+) Transcript_9833:800-1450(+)